MFGIASHMPVTETYQPLQPIYAPDDGSAYASLVVLRAWHVAGALRQLLLAVHVAAPEPVELQATPNDSARATTGSLNALNCRRRKKIQRAQNDPNALNCRRRKMIAPGEMGYVKTPSIIRQRGAQLASRRRSKTACSRLSGPAASTRPP